MVVPIPERSKTPSARDYVHDITLQLGGKGLETIAIGVQDDLAKTASFVAQDLEVGRDGVKAVGAKGR